MDFPMWLFRKGIAMNGRNNSARTPAKTLARHAAAHEHAE